MAISPAFIGGNTHFIWWREDKKMYYMVYDWTIADLTCEKIHEENVYPSFGIFHGTKTETWEGQTQYEAYIAVNRKKLDDKSGSGHDTP